MSAPAKESTMRRILLLGLTAFAATGPALAMTNPRAIEETSRTIEGAIPEPAAALLFAAGMAVVAWRIGRRRSA
jgi:PEP-CTERM motif